MSLSRVAAARRENGVVRPKGTGYLAASRLSGVCARVYRSASTVDELGASVVSPPTSIGSEVVVSDPVASQSPGRSPDASDGAPADSGSSPGSGSVEAAPESSAQPPESETKAAPEASSVVDGPADQKAAAAGANAATASGSGGFAGVVEWFWRGEAIRAVHDRGTTLNPRGQELLRRARLAAELAGRALEPSEPLTNGAGDAVACELYRQSLEWALAASQERGRAAAADGEGEKKGLDALWEAADPALFASVSDADALRSQITGKNFRHFADLEASEQNRLALKLRELTETLTASLDAAQSELDRLWLQRLLRLAALVAVVAGLVLLVVKASTWSEAEADLARDAMWRASSVYGPEPGCKPPAQECASSPNFFIATNEEENPWLVFDLESPKSVSAVRVDNRIDCCQDRANPLVIEVSDDEKTWKEVARRTSDFNTWKATFPTVKTRYVRLRILKKTNLNLSRVRILP